MTRTVLILGATGRFGRNATQAFRAAGWDVRGFDRATEELSVAARGVDVIVNAWNPPYQDWARQVPRLHADVRRVALANDATVIIPGNVYVFGDTTPAPWGPNTPHRATNPLGRIRIEMEAAYRRDGVRTIILRAGDFIDTEASGNWFDKVMIKDLARGVFTLPGQPDLPHAWAYLPDVTRAAVMLADQRFSLPRFADFCFEGYSMTGAEMADALGSALGREIRVKQMSWLPLYLARPFVPMIRHLFEMRYLWNTAHSLDGAALAAVLPDMPTTPLDKALRSAVPAQEVAAQMRHRVA